MTSPEAVFAKACQETFENLAAWHERYLETLDQRLAQNTLALKRYKNSTTQADQEIARRELALMLAVSRLVVEARLGLPADKSFAGLPPADECFED
jgi:hypothetical protein